MKWKRLEEKCTKNAHMSKLKTKNLIIMFFDICGIILKHWIPRGQTVNAVSNTEVLKQLPRAIAVKKPELWKVNN